MLRRRLYQGLVVGVAMTFLSGAPPSPRRSARVALHSSSTVASVERTSVHRHESFELVSANNGEKMTVELVDGEVTPESQRQAKHLMRCLKNDQEHDIDPRLLVTLWQLAHDNGGTLLLISGFRTPERRGDKNFHTLGMAADVRIPGSWSWRMRDAARKIGVRGLGTYPTTNMIHVDVRTEPFTWVDWSGPRH
jgi:uncharacterized protein YcbK (DUF882 family)